MHSSGHRATLPTRCPRNVYPVCPAWTTWDRRPSTCTATWCTTRRRPKRVWDECNDGNTSLGCSVYPWCVPFHGMHPSTSAGQTWRRTCPRTVNRSGQASSRESQSMCSTCCDWCAADHRWSCSHVRRPPTSYWSNAVRSGNGLHWGYSLASP